MNQGFLRQVQDEGFMGANNKDDAPKAGIESALSPEIQEMAQIIAQCLYKKGKGSLPKQVVSDAIANLGSARLRKFWEKRSAIPSVLEMGYIRALPAPLHTAFRGLRDKLLADMTAQSQTITAHGDNINRDEVFSNDMIIDISCNSSKREDEGPVSVSPSLPVVPTALLPPELQELARLVAECTTTKSSKICHDTLAVKVLSSGCQMLKDRWNGMASLTRFQRDGYSMLIPRAMREPFLMHRDNLLSSWENGITKPTSHLKNFTDAETIVATSATIRHQEETNLGYESHYDEVKDSTVTEYRADDESLDAADAAARKRDNTALSDEYSGGEGGEEPNTKRIQIAAETWPPAALSIEEIKDDLEHFFKWRHLRLDLAHEQFLDEIMRGWHPANVDRARIDLEAHYDFELDKLTKLKERCCPNLVSGSAQSVSIESFFELVAVNWKTFFNDVLNECGPYCCEGRAEIFDRKQRDGYTFFVAAEKEWVQLHLT